MMDPLQRATTNPSTPRTYAGRTLQYIEARYVRYTKLISLLKDLFGELFAIEQRDEHYMLQVPRALNLAELQSLTDSPSRPLRKLKKTKSIPSSLSSSQTASSTVSRTALPTAHDITFRDIGATGLADSSVVSLRIRLKDDRLDLPKSPVSDTGIFSDVYAVEVDTILAEGPPTKKIVAIKKLKSRAGSRQSFEAEVKALARLKAHPPNVIFLLSEPWDYENELALIFPLAKSNLESYLTGVNQDDRFVSSIWQHFDLLARALSDIHEELIFHGDLKPENILVFDNPETNNLIFRISDFGHSICDNDTAESQNYFANAGAYPLNPSYSAPELWNHGTVKLGPCDIWALGCQLLELLSFIHGGSDEVRSFRRLRMSAIGPIVVDTFHDSQQLKPQVLEYFELLNAFSKYHSICQGILGMLQCDPDARSTAGEACDAMSNVQPFSNIPELINLISLCIPFYSVALNCFLRPFECPKDVDLHFWTVLILIQISILSGTLITGLAVSIRLRTLLWHALFSPEMAIFLLSILCFIFWTFPQAAVSILDPLDFMILPRAPCPFPLCPTRSARTGFQYPEEWFHHQIKEHMAAPEIMTAGSSGASTAANVSVAQSSRSDLAGLPTSDASISSPSSSSKKSISTKRDSTNQYLQTNNSTVETKALDLCFPDFPFDDVHLWKDLPFPSSATDGVLFEGLADAYAKGQKSPIPPFKRLLKILHSFFAFTRLSLIRPMKFRLVPDLFDGINKAMCTPYTTAPNPVPEFLRDLSTQRYLARCVRDAPRLRYTSNMSPNAWGRTGYYVKWLKCLTRDAHPQPADNWEGPALQFVEAWDVEKLNLQLVLALLFFILLGIVVGSTTKSVDKGFLVLGAGVAISQLLVAALVFLVPPASS